MALQSLVSASIGRIAGAITPSDTLPNVWSYIYVGSGGDIKATTENGDVVTFTAVPQGTYLWCRVSVVWATGTTASSLVGHR